MRPFPSPRVQLQPLALGMQTNSEDASSGQAFPLQLTLSLVSGAQCHPSPLGCVAQALVSTRGSVLG